MKSFFNSILKINNKNYKLIITKLNDLENSFNLELINKKENLKYIINQPICDKDNLDILCDGINNKNGFIINLKDDSDNSIILQVKHVKLKFNLEYVLNKCIINNTIDQNIINYIDKKINNYQEIIILKSFINPLITDNLNLNSVLSKENILNYAVNNSKTKTSVNYNANFIKYFYDMKQIYCENLKELEISEDDIIINYILGYYVTQCKHCYTILSKKTEYDDINYDDILGYIRIYDNYDKYNCSYAINYKIEINIFEKNYNGITSKELINISEKEYYEKYHIMEFPEDCEIENLLFSDYDTRNIYFVKDNKLYMNYNDFMEKKSIFLKSCKF